MNMTPEEQRALVQFFGTVHAQAKQTDQMIVGNSQFVKPVSPSIKHQLEQALQIPVEASPQNSYQHHIEHPTVAVVDPSQAIQELQTFTEPSTIEQPTKYSEVPSIINNIESHNIQKDGLIEVLKEINLNLARIGDILEKKNGTSKKTKSSKSD